VDAPAARLGVQDEFGGAPEVVRPDLRAQRGEFFDRDIEEVGYRAGVGDRVAESAG
jgi:hypothetical protein